MDSCSSLAAQHFIGPLQLPSPHHTHFPIGGTIENANQTKGTGQREHQAYQVNLLEKTWKNIIKEREMK